MRLGWGTRIVLSLCVFLSLVNELYFLLKLRAAEDSSEEKAKRLAIEGYLCPYLIIILGRTPWWAFWTLFTAPFVQKKLIPSLIILFVIVTGGSYCERSWSTPSYLRFVIVALAGPVFLETVVGGLLWRRGLLGVYGANGLLAGIVISLRQLIPGHRIILLRNRIRVQIKWLPSLFLVFFVVIQALGFEENAGAFYIGFVLSWVYLRYFNRNERGEIGDASDAFSFIYMFPKPVVTVCEPLLDKVHYVLVKKLKLVKQFTQEEVQGANERYAARLSGQVLPSFTGRNARATNERRKSMLRAMGAAIN